MLILLKILETQACQFCNIIREIVSYPYSMPNSFMNSCREFKDASFGKKIRTNARGRIGRKIKIKLAFFLGTIRYKPIIQLYYNNTRSR